jgi:(S)-2-hydroxyglutarate dehydrogenase
MRVMRAADYLVVGGGIVGLATAWALQCRAPKARLLVVDKERDWALHQTGRNSGVLHSGIYYRPGSLKAKLCREGRTAMVVFCREHGIAHELCGKVIVATRDTELPMLEQLLARGRENGLELESLEREQVRELEPEVNCRRGIRVPATGIVDFRAVCLKLVELLRAGGAELALNLEVKRIQRGSNRIRVITPAGEWETRVLVNCAGLQSDRVASMDGLALPARIVPFRGEYYELAPERRYLVRSLIYPVPNPEFPFLGVHFTRMIDGSVHAGPNAVLSLKREGYSRTAFAWRDAWSTLGYGGFWRLARRHAGEAFREMHRSFSKPAFVRSLQELVPSVRAEDLLPAAPGVRAQALRPDGGLVDDFLIVHAPGAVHVLNAPSPAATAALEIGRRIVDEVPSV